MRNIEVNIEKLKSTIKKSSLTSQSLAKSIGISPHDIYNGYKGNGIKYEKLVLIAKKLNKPVEYFLNEGISYIEKLADKDQEYDNKPYDPELYRTILDMIEATLIEQNIKITPEKIKNLHSRIYNMVAGGDNISSDFLDGVVKSTIEYYF